MCCKELTGHVGATVQVSAVESCKFTARGKGDASPTRETESAFYYQRYFVSRQKTGFQRVLSTRPPKFRETGVRPMSSRRCLQGSRVDRQGTGRHLELEKPRHKLPAIDHDQQRTCAVQGFTRCPPLHSPLISVLHCFLKDQIAVAVHNVTAQGHGRRGLSRSLEELPGQLASLSRFSPRECKHCKSVPFKSFVLARRSPADIQLI